MLCTIPDCSAVRKRRGLCTKHVQRVLRHGDHTTTKVPRRHEKDQMNKTKLHALIGMLDKKLAEASANRGRDEESVGRHWEALGAARYLVAEVQALAAPKESA